MGRNRLAYRLGIIVLGLALCWQSGAQPLPPFVPPEPDPWVPPHPVLGVHTRLTDESDPQKIRRTLSMVRAMGAVWVVEYFPWGYHEPQPGIFHWQHSDLVVSEAHRLGLKLIARVDYVPDWARPPNTNVKYLTAERWADFGRFLTAFATRYRGLVYGYVVWNEPNLAAEWGFRPPDPAEYAGLLRVAYEAIKQADPAARVALAGLAPTVERSARAMPDLDFLEAVYRAGGRDFFDAVAVHAYGGVRPPNDPPAPDRVNFARLELIRDIMVRNGDGAKPVWVTEAGWNDHPYWKGAVSPAARIDYTIRALEMAERNWPYVQVVAFWLFRLPRPARNFNDYFAFVAPDFTPRPIYYAVRAWALGE